MGEMNILAFVEDPGAVNGVLPIAGFWSQWAIRFLSSLRDMLTL